MKVIVKNNCLGGYVKFKSPSVIQFDLVPLISDICCYAYTNH